MPDVSSHRFVRDRNASDLLELSLVYAVVTVLGIRGFLALTGYPQLGGGSLHIAHMLWGGLGMFMSIVLLLSFWNPVMRQFAAGIGGIGFGFFIDELGKFITSDNDYFFQPTIALIYVLFIGLFLIVHAMHSKPLTARELSANDEIIRAIASDGESTRFGRVYNLILKQLAAGYRRLVSTRWFAPALSAAFVVAAIGQIVTVYSLIAGHTADTVRNVPLVEQFATASSAICILVGVFRLRRSRLSAFRWFQRGTLVTICITQVFMFYYSELAALGGLTVHLALYYALRFLIQHEEKLSQSESRT